MSFLQGLAQGASKELSDQEARAFQLKLQSAQIEAQVQAATVQHQRSLASPDVTAKVFGNAGMTPKPGQQETVPALGLLQSGFNAQQRARGSQRPTVKGSFIMDNLPNGKELGLDPNGDYPMAVANFASNVTKIGMGTADMRNQLTGITSFEKNLSALKETYDSFEPSNPSVKLAEEKWAELLRGYSPTGNRTAVEAAADLKDRAMNADNADVANMLAMRINLAMEYARATNGARPSDKDFENALKVVPGYSADSKLRDLRFESLSSNSASRRQAIFEQAPKLKPGDEPKDPKTADKGNPGKPKKSFEQWRAEQEALKNKAR